MEPNREESWLSVLEGLGSSSIPETGAAIEPSVLRNHSEEIGNEAAINLGSFSVFLGSGSAPSNSVSDSVQSLLPSVPLDVDEVDRQDFIAELHRLSGMDAQTSGANLSEVANGDLAGSMASLPSALGSSGSESGTCDEESQEPSDEESETEILLADLAEEYRSPVAAAIASLSFPSLTSATAAGEVEVAEKSGLQLISADALKNAVSSAFGQLLSNLSATAQQVISNTVNHPTVASVVDSVSGCTSETAMFVADRSKYLSDLYVTGVIASDDPDHLHLQRLRLATELLKLVQEEMTIPRYADTNTDRIQEGRDDHEDVIEGEPKSARADIDEPRAKTEEAHNRAAIPDIRRYFVERAELIDRIHTVAASELSMQMTTLPWQQRQLLRETKEVDDAIAALAEVIEAHQAATAAAIAAKKEEETKATKSHKDAGPEGADSCSQENIPSPSTGGGADGANGVAAGLAASASSTPSGGQQPSSTLTSPYGLTRFVFAVSKEVAPPCPPPCPSSVTAQVTVDNIDPGTSGGVGVRDAGVNGMTDTVEQSKRPPKQSRSDTSATSTAIKVAVVSSSASSTSSTGQTSVRTTSMPASWLRYGNIPVVTDARVVGTAPLTVSGTASESIPGTATGPQTTSTNLEFSEASSGGANALSELFQSPATLSTGLAASASASTSTRSWFGFLTGQKLPADDSSDSSPNTSKDRKNDDGPGSQMQSASMSAVQSSTAIDDSSSPPDGSFTFISAEMQERAMTSLALAACFLRCFSPPPFENSHQCSFCLRTFGVSLFRHHCRCCGKSVCTAHSDHRRPIVKYGIARAVRVCDVCAHTLDEQERIDGLLWRQMRLEAYLRGDLIPYSDAALDRGVDKAIRYRLNDFFISDSNEHRAATTTLNNFFLFNVVVHFLSTEWPSVPF
jgi:hypothetical protein